MSDEQRIREAAESLYEAAALLRHAQRLYMANRGNEEIGKTVADRATKLDLAIAEYDEVRAKIRAGREGGKA
jgi:hypothetical protein